MDKIKNVCILSIEWVLVVLLILIGVILGIFAIPTLILLGIVLEGIGLLEKLKYKHTKKRDKCLR